jgi:uncharacterized SAM-binding protein YcdF (DUF218 family)
MSLFWAKKSSGFYQFSIRHQSTGQISNTLPNAEFYWYYCKNFKQLSQNMIMGTGNKPKLKRIVYVFAGMLFALFVILFMLFAGTFLVKSETVLPKTDATVILMGSIADRVLEANDLYKAGLVKRLIIVNNIQYGGEALEPYGVTIPNFAALSAQALVQLNIPDSVIRILPGRAASTRAEADTLAAWISANPDIGTLTIVTSSAHTRRAFMIFKDAFNDQHIPVKISCAPSKYSEFNARFWWKERESAKQVFMEYVKLLTFVCIEQWL